MSYFKFGLSREFECSYLPDHKEQLLVYIDEEPMTQERYTFFQQEGFRRSQDIVYRPHCQGCNACQSVRLEVKKFKPSRSQKRIINKCRRFSVKVSYEVRDSYYPLFENYINSRHHDGVMYPAEPSQLDSFAVCEWLKPWFIEVYDDDKLIGVGVSDPSSTTLSAVYSFFDPDYSSYSLGTFLVLKQIDLAIKTDRNFLYLGYYIEDCQKMNYKTNFKPYQIRLAERWVKVE